MTFAGAANAVVTLGLDEKGRGRATQASTSAVSANARDLEVELWKRKANSFLGFETAHGLGRDFLPATRYGSRPHSYGEGSEVAAHTDVRVDAVSFFLQ